MNNIWSFKEPQCHRGLERRASDAPWCWVGAKRECGGPMFLLVVVHSVWQSKKRPSHGTESISYPWTSTSFLVVFWQVWPCSRPASGSPEAHENKQCMKWFSFIHPVRDTGLGCILPNDTNPYLPANAFLSKHFLFFLFLDVLEFYFYVLGVIRQVVAIVCKISQT